MIRSRIEVGIHKMVDLVPSLVRANVVKVKLFRTIRQYIWEYCIVLILCDLESTAETDKDLKLVVEDVVRSARIVSISSPAFWEC
jgi:hypothetical protein